MSIKKYYIGTICNRDLEVLKDIKRFVKQNYNLKLINLLKKGTFSVRYFKKKLKKYNFSLFIIKLFSEESNQVIYNALKIHAPNVPRLNSGQSVETCESRKDTFKLIEEKCKKIYIPRTYFSVKEAFEAVSNGTPIIIKLNTHNIRNLSKYDRIIGIAKSPEDFNKLIRNYNIQRNVLFFQEFLGKYDIVHKVYVIDKWVQTITSHNILRHHKLSPLDLVHIRVPIGKDLKRRILKIGRKFGMSIFGVDYILTKEGIPYIVDINDFPSFRHIPEGISLISDYMFEFLEAREKLSKIPMKFKVKTYMA